MHGYILNFPKESTHNVPEWLIERKCSVHSHFTRSCDQDVPIRNTMGTPWIFPKKVLLVFLSGSFEMYFVMFPAVWSQCSQPVKLKMNQNGVLEMFLSGTSRMSWHFRPWWTTFGKIWGNFGNTASTFKMFPVFWFPWHVLAVFPKFPQILPKVVHHGRKCQDILDVPLRNISGTLFWFILSFTGWEHCDHTTRNTTKYISNEPLGNTRDTFFGKIQGVPMVYLIRIFWSHDLVNCRCTEHFLSMSHSGTL